MTFTDNNQLLPVIDLKIDKIFDKGINISNEDIFFNQDELINKELFLQIRNRAKFEKMTKKIVTQTYEFFLYNLK